MNRSGRKAAAEENAIRSACNQCPICWMPLEVGLGTHDDKWRAVQATFKGKPAFGVQNGYSRPVVAFGIYPMLSGGRRSNAESCHYVHYTNLGTHLQNSPWWAGRGGDGSGIDTALDQRTKPVDAAFYTALFSKNANPNALAAADKTYPGGLFEFAFCPNSLMDQFFRFIAASLNAAAVETVSRMMVTETFVGCSDCNGNMSIPSYPTRGHISFIFDQLFPTAGQMDTEHMTHYILLCGALDAQDQDQADQTKFNVQAAKQPTWAIRYILMWCLLQILLCMWHIQSLDAMQKHHVEYIYTGVMDFYLSLCFFAMHQVDFQNGGSPDLKFTDFHFYYASLYPMSLGSNSESHSLSAFVFNNLSYKRPSDDQNAYTTMKRQMETLCDCIVSTWDSHMKYMSNAIHNKSIGTPGAVAGFNSSYFMNVDAVISRKSQLLSINPISIQTFVEAVGARYYWLHFRHLTMRSIAARAEAYRSILPQSAAVQALWFNWCRLMDRRVNALGVRLYLQKRKEWIEARLLAN